MQKGGSSVRRRSDEYYFIGERSCKCGNGSIKMKIQAEKIF